MSRRGTGPVGVMEEGAIEICLSPSREGLRGDYDNVFHIHDMIVIYINSKTLTNKDYL